MKKKKRKILLVEPNYKNKYPPIGLMKIATYHRMLGDHVRFFKGDLRDLVVDELFEICLRKLNKIDSSINWNQKTIYIKQFIRTGKTEFFEALNINGEKYAPLTKSVLGEYSKMFRKKEYGIFWDRIYVTTLFTFYWKKTVQTIHFLKPLVKDPNQLYVGGVLATLLNKELEKETGIKPYQGLLDRPGILDKGNKAIIDELPLDYSILDEIDYKYPTGSAYFTYMTKGCTRKCAFCAVPILEPTYKPIIETKNKINEIRKLYGEQRNLLLMDNNILASPDFPDIIREIKDMGFEKGATWIEPNQLDISIKNLKTHGNKKAYIRRTYNLFHELVTKLKGDQRQFAYNVLYEYELLNLQTVKKKNLLAAYKSLKDLNEKHRNKSPKSRYVDFNQGVDARYINEEKMKLISEIPIRPLRIAFDYIGIQDKYVEAVRLASKYGIRNISNYIFYNYNDKPEDLYRRLEINIGLCKKYDVAIYSFPMKYIPASGKDTKHREFTGKYWNKKFIRAVQSVLNVTKGIVAPSSRNVESSFFHKAFGNNIDEFFQILYMPELYIIYRSIFEELRYTNVWKEEYYLIKNSRHWAETKQIIESNNFLDIEERTSNFAIREFLRHYQLPKDIIKDENKKCARSQYDKIINSDYLANLFSSQEKQPINKVKVTA